ncbi:MAG: DUF4333 domain-containing protein [Pseudonocardia sp.]|nr:DUF4333 domain-containing protein [Pseudonocardia sp.]
MRRSVVLVLPVLVVGCTQSVAGTATAAPRPVLDSAAVERDVRAVVAQDPARRDAVAGAQVVCPHDVPADRNLVVFCDVTGAGLRLTVPVTILDADGNYQVGIAF